VGSWYVNIGEFFLFTFAASAPVVVFSILSAVVASASAEANWLTETATSVTAFNSPDCARAGRDVLSPSALCIGDGESASS
jgi:hypothetical protein